MPDTGRGIEEVAEAARGRAAHARWLSRSRNEELTITAASDLSVTRRPPREGTVVREMADGVQREWAVPGWHDDWITATTPTEEFRWTGEEPVAAVPLAAKIDRVREIQDALRQSEPRVAQVFAQVVERTERRHITTDRFDRNAEITRVMVGAMVVVHDRGRTEQAFVVEGGAGGFELTRLSPERLKKLVEEAVRMLDAAPVDPGTYRVVAAPEVSGVLAHEAFGHGVEMDLFLSGRTRAREALGTEVGSRWATIIDDPTRRDGYGSYPIDDDGSLAAPHVILDQGRLVGGLADDEVARLLASASPGNGRRQDYSRKVYPRMSNTLFAAGGDTLPDLMARVDSGIYLRRVESGMEDPKNWGMQITVHAGEEIKNGRLTGKLYRTMAMTGFVPDVLKSIDGATGEIEMSPGWCGKGWKEWTTNGTGGPHLSMTVRLG